MERQKQREKETIGETFSPPEWTERVETECSARGCVCAKAREVKSKMVCGSRVDVTTGRYSCAGSENYFGFGWCVACGGNAELPHISESMATQWHPHSNVDHNLITCIAFDDNSLAQNTNIVRRQRGSELEPLNCNYSESANFFDTRNVTVDAWMLHEYAWATHGNGSKKRMIIPSNVINKFVTVSYGMDPISSSPCQLPPEMWQTDTSDSARLAIFDRQSQRNRHHLPYLLRCESQQRFRQRTGTQFSDPLSLCRRLAECCCSETISSFPFCAPRNGQISTNIEYAHTVTVFGTESKQQQMRRYILAFNWHIQYQCPAQCDAVSPVFVCVSTKPSLRHP